MTYIEYRASICRDWGKDADGNWVWGTIAKINKTTYTAGGPNEHKIISRLLITPDTTGADITAWLRKRGFKGNGWAPGSHTGIQRTTLTKI